MQLSYDYSPRTNSLASLTRFQAAKFPPDLSRRCKVRAILEFMAGNQLTSSLDR
jgi:hypothetical protein